MSTYTFDVAAIITVNVPAPDEARARELIDGLNQLSVQTTDEDIEMGGQLNASTRDFSVTCVCPRGRGYLVKASEDAGSGLELDVMIPEPVLDEHGHLAGLWEGISFAEEALNGDSNDAEHDALYGLVESLTGALDALGIKRPAQGSTS